jgi:hypothetical protein
MSFSKELMGGKIQQYFIFSVAVILFITATAKIVSATGTAEALSHPDPLIPLSNRQVFYMTGGIEIIISAFLLMKRDAQGIKLSLIAWLATTFLVYRAGLWWAGAPNLCDCLGNINAEVSISPQTIHYITLILLAWLLMGSGLLLIFNWFGRRRANAELVRNAQ